MHWSASITNLPSPSEMQLTGHSASHAPHAMHSSVILNAMTYTSIMFCNYHCSSIAAKNQDVFTKKSAKTKSFFVLKEKSVCILLWRLGLFALARGDHLDLVAGIELHVVVALVVTHLDCL